ncbi:hypothetical protein [Vibrio pomeroyi]|uniref:hypothetical protein n=1 Tax=Vibrio pomeroyi TaxID=198832 RepID=UPI0021C2D7AB|nr:hypothetical protein [Vibrio pomeroyi]
MKSILIITQGFFGGTDRILSDFFSWCQNEGYNATIVQQDEIKNSPIGKENYDYIVLPTSAIFTLKYLFGDAKVLIWSMGHDAIEAAFYNREIKNPIYNLVFRGLYTLFDKISRGNRVFAFTDEVAVNHARREVGREIILPIPIDIPPKNEYEYNATKSFYWLGRVDRDFKVWTLLEILNNLEKHEFNGVFNIIGGGDGVSLIDSDNYSFKIVRHGNLPYDVMEEYLKINASLVFAMGTSALEGSKLGVPTILVNPLRQGERNFDSRWVFDSIGFSLGEFKLSNVMPEQPKFGLQTLIDEFNNNPQVLSSKSYEYSNNFSREKVYSDLMSNFEKFDKLSSIKVQVLIHYLTKKLKSYKKT